MQSREALAIIPPDLLRVEAGEGRPGDSIVLQAVKTEVGDHDIAIEGDQDILNVGLGSLNPALSLGPKTDAVLSAIGYEPLPIR